MPRRAELAPPGFDDLAVDEEIDYLRSVGVAAVTVATLTSVVPAGAVAVAEFRAASSRTYHLQFEMCAVE